MLRQVMSMLMTVAALFVVRAELERVAHLADVSAAQRGGLDLFVAELESALR